MTTPCNDVDDSTTNYAVRHVPFIHYDDVRTDTTRCDAHVVDLSTFLPDSAPQYTFIAPNLVDDMHDPFPAPRRKGLAERLHDPTLRLT